MAQEMHVAGSGLDWRQTGLLRPIGLLGVTVPLLLVLSACPTGIGLPDRVVSPDAVGIIEVATAS